MKKGLLILCDPNEGYIQALGEYLRSSQLPMEIEVFTQIDKVKDFAVRQKPDILLADESLEKELASIPALHKGLLSASDQGGEVNGYILISKYRSADKIQAQIARLAGGYANETGLREKKRYAGSVVREEPGRYYPLPRKQPESLPGRAGILGVYSPIGRCGKTSFAVVLGEILAEEKNVLYLNLEEYDGFEEDTSYGEGTLSDLLYYAGQEDESLVFKLSSMVRTWKNLDYVPPAPTGEDYAAVEVSLWEYFLKRLAAESDYEVIILDIGTQVRDLPGVLNLCEKIYVPVLHDPAAKRKVGRFMQRLTDGGYDFLFQRMVRLKLPLVQPEWQEKPEPFRLIRTPLGDMVRRLLAAERQEERGR